jgi:hypothetical protein
MTVLNRLSAEYPAFVSLEAIRGDTNLDEQDFRRVAAYLQEKQYIDLDNVKQGVGGVYGSARITVLGLDYAESRSRQVRVSIIR